ncbi:MAG: helix-turn-helix transcriptional regulator [Chthoniobacter sp.]|nr:helix-turn-helix transcriptional regulator [Chthoniobacter sp.]
MIRKCRLDLGLLQREAAAQIGCDTDTVTNWEKGRSTPDLKHVAKVVEFLGFNPFELGDSLGERLASFRRERSMSRKDFARQIGVDPSTLAKWERGDRKPTGLFLSGALVAMDAKTPISNTSIKTPAIQVPQDGWGQRLLEHRTARHLSQRQVAARIGVAQTTIARWESGEHYPTGLWLKALVAELAVSR